MLVRFGFKSGGPQEGNDVDVEDRIVIQNDVAIRSRLENVLAVAARPNRRGCGVTLKCRILRRSCSMTKKQYTTRNVAVGTVKRSKATMASRWL